MAVGLQSSVGDTIEDRIEWINKVTELAVAEDWHAVEKAMIHGEARGDELPEGLKVIIACCREPAAITTCGGRPSRGTSDKSM
jgi:hypothetical protein